MTEQDVLTFLASTKKIPSTQGNGQVAKAMSLRMAASSL
jgi:hypothetical protein